MESLVMQNLFNGIYLGKTVLLTGHTGFKGSWLALWLTKMGARVIGYSLEAPTTPNHIELLDLDIISIIGDIRDGNKLKNIFNTYKPDIVFHLAAQPLVRYSYENPHETFEVNIMGTVNIYEAVKSCPSVKAIVNITSDKAYENKEWVWGYRENDPMGGYDPYSASKGAAELVTSSYRNSFFNNDEYGVKHNTLLASCRAGNVIGGGDWAEDRLVPDMIRAVAKNKIVEIRSPNATRPWQHVLEPLSGYLLVGQKLLEGKKEFAEGWNFGPSDEASITVKEVVEYIKDSWNKIEYEINEEANKLHEANLLKLDCSKAHTLLKWNNIWNAEETFQKTVEWYKNYYENKELFSLKDLENFIEKGKAKKLSWCSYE